MTYGNGSFWRTLPRPRLCFDISPQKPEAQVGDSRMLPVEPASLRNVVFDPPFLTYVKNGREHNSKVAMTSRFGGYYRYDELEDHYRDSISEAYRVLKPGGKMIFKCQDIIHNHRMHCTHFKVILMAEIEGFRLADMFVLAAKHRMPGPQKGQQRHARIWHSYFLVLEKASSRTGAVAPPPEDGANPRPLA
jgi:DNA modification methylase